MELQIDQQALLDYYDGDKDLCKLMFTEFLNQIETTWTSVQNAIQMHDIPFAINQIHKSKPTFSMVGLSDVHMKIDEFEKSLRINLYSEEEIKNRFNEINMLALSSKKCVERELLSY